MQKNVLVAQVVSRRLLVRLAQLELLLVVRGLPLQALSRSDVHPLVQILLLLCQAHAVVHGAEDALARLGANFALQRLAQTVGYRI